MTLYSYIVNHDTGVSPNPFFGIVRWRALQARDQAENTGWRLNRRVDAQSARKPGRILHESGRADGILSLLERQPFRRKETTVRQGCSASMWRQHLRTLSQRRVPATPIH